MKKPEILAPTGTRESVIAAVNGGCDAIYIGGSAYSARAYAQNPSDDDLAEIIKACHLRGVKVFITLNTLYKEEELNAVIHFAQLVFNMGADGLIIQDLGLFSVLRDCFKGSGIILSASTQLTAHSEEAVAKLSSMGFKRVVLARELSAGEIADICEHKGDTEIEGFIHGALCVCYSGRCLMSSLIGARSGNRGRCAQPCRMEYSLYRNNRKLTDGCLLSPKDISALDILDEVATLGLDSLKIEGRMKSPEYVYEVVSTYRKYIDKLYNGGELNIDPQDSKDITQIFNRGGSSSTGYYNTFAGRSMMSESQKSSGVEIGKVKSYHRKSKKCCILLSDSVVAGDGVEIWSEPHCGGGVNKALNAGEELWLTIEGNIREGDRVFKSYDKALNDRLKRTYRDFERQLSVKAEISFVLGQPCRIVFPEYGISVEGDVAEAAQSSPMTRDDIISRLCKTGGTEFSFAIISAEVDDNIYIPVSRLNALRREACDKLRETVISRGLRHCEPVVYDDTANRLEKAAEPKLSVRVRTAEQFRAALMSGVDRVYSESISSDMVKNAHAKGIELYYALPHIARDGYVEYFKTGDKAGCDGYLLRCHTNALTDKPIALDYTFNIMNSATVGELKRAYCASTYTLSTELNTSELKKIADKDSEIYVYGRLPLMTTHQCPIGLYDGGKESGKFCSRRGNSDKYSLTDRKGISFPVMNCCEGCYAQILNSSPVAVTNRIAEVLNIKAGWYTVELTTENYRDASNIVAAYVSAVKEGIAAPTDFFRGKATGGHLFRGVQ
jgi:putative protease